MITLQNIDKHYGPFHALKNVSAEIGAGEFFSLLGPSGCGKTTLLRVIAGFEEVSAGQVEIDGRSMMGVPANKRPTNMVFQSYAIFPHLSVGENVGFGLRKSGLSKDEMTRAIGNALEMVGLSGYEPRAAHAMSGGQRQRVALARALILKPKVLLLDEPLSALDKKMREQMQGELRSLQRQVGITFVLVTHDQEEALIMSDRIAVMFDGEIAQMAAPQALYKRPVSRRVGEFIGVMNFLPATLTGADRGKTTLDVQGFGPALIDSSQITAGAGTQNVVGIRPESLSILYGTDDASAQASGVVADLAYYGDMTYYEILIDGTEKPITISMKNLSSRPVLDRGARTQVSWDEKSLVVFEA